MTKLSTENTAMLAVALSGLAWGLFWIPLRALDVAGIMGVWAVVLFYVLPALFLLPAIILRRRRIIAGGWRLHLAGLLAGTSLVCYAGALVFTDVVRALLFYYLTPVWSTLLARVLLGERITMHRWAMIGLALTGLMFILRVDEGLGGAFNIGDWMGIAGGLLWAVAAVVMNSDEGGNGIDFTLSYFVWGSVAALLLALLPIEGATSAPDWETIRSVLWWIVPVAIVLVIPPAFAIMWGATVLSPGLLAILFMTEISAGTVTAAIWADEPFGLRQILGVLLITAAGVLEPVTNLLRGKTLESRP
ncbi:DMT family transporter [Methyloligella sp. 2.7D]|uniref:DMT family transporter n=1 Tax=unclassified Methyloligella TaxID=2625955 RepID=UPI00157D86CB|nr:DMT family transporter [Methyloligella sp. GL2]QKP77885.1 DMT family transporter [Methyloligella sp. GL2]